MDVTPTNPAAAWWRATVEPETEKQRNDVAADGTITVRLVRTTFFTRWPCTVCGGVTDKVVALAEARTPEGIVRVCESCLQDGKIDERLEAHAQSLLKDAADARSLIGRLRVPTFAQWQTAREQFNREDEEAAVARGDPRQFNTPPEVDGPWPSDWN
jgi:hypothetical protein